MTESLTSFATAAARFLGVLDSGESLSSQQLADALDAANQLLDNWSSEGLFIIADTITTGIALVAAQQAYTIGPAETIDIARPAKIQAASFLNASGEGGAIKVVNEQEWAELPDRQAQSNRIRFLFYDRGFPTGSIYLSPVPLSTHPTLEIHTWAALTEFADTTTAITVQPGYGRMITLGLAIELSSQYDMAVPASVGQLFADAAERVRKLNASLLGDIPPELLAEAKGAA